METAGIQRDEALTARLSRELDASLRGAIHVFQEVASTMDVAHALAAEGAVEGTLVWARRQTGGRGRLGRTWESPEGGAYFSIILRPERPATEIPQLSLIAGLATTEAIRECANVSARVRWPNDVLLGGKKVAGILTEAKNGSVVLGIGVNVATSLSDLPETATSLTAAGATATDPYLLTARLYRRFFRWYEVWTGTGFSPVRNGLRAHLALLGEVVHVTAGSVEFEGTAADLDEAGRLLVRLDSGLMRPFEMGEVSLLT